MKEKETQKYTARDRQLAICICQVAAMTPDLHGMLASSATSLGIKRQHAEELAEAAWQACEGLLNDGTYTDAMLDAEAECLLRDGWSPGDPIRYAVSVAPTATGAAHE